MTIGHFHQRSIEPVSRRRERRISGVVSDRQEFSRALIDHTTPASSALTLHLSLSTTYCELFDNNSYYRASPILTITVIIA